MKKLIDKLEHNKFFFALFMVVAFSLFKFITTGFNGIFGFGGIIHYIINISNTTDSGLSILGEIVWGLCLIPVLLLFGNKYIFSQKKRPFKERLAVTWPMLVIIISLLLNDIKIISLTGFNTNEFFAAAVLFFFVGIYEEFLCRGWLLNEFMERFGNTRKGIIYSIFLSALLFGLMHITNIMAGQSVAQTIAQIIMATAIGIYFGVVYLKTKNIWSVVLLHGLYDFALALRDINVTTSCFFPSGMGDLTGIELVSTAISSTFINLFLQAACVLIAVKYFTKTGTNEIINGEPLALDDKQIRRSKIARRVLTIIAIVFSSLVGSIILIGTLFADDTGDVCLTYTTKEISNYESTIVNYHNYKLNYSKNVTENVYCIMEPCEPVSYVYSRSYEFINNGDSLEIKNLNDNDSTILKFHRIISMAVYKNAQSYVVMIIDAVEDGSLVYYINFEEEKLANDNFVSYFEDNFKKLDLPIIVGVGYLTENGNKLPLFKTQYNSAYVLDIDGNIKMLEIK